MNVRDILSRTPPRLLYHYTAQAGLLGIISNKEIWASHTQYLNDRHEYQHAISLAREELAEMKTEAKDDGRELLNEMEKALKGAEAMNVCVCSFFAGG